jgi:type I restriction enzyme S subunit
MLTESTIEMPENFTEKPGYKKTELGWIPKDWEVKRLGEIVYVEGGFALESYKFTNDGYYQVVKMSNLYQGNLDLKRSSSFLKQIDKVEEHYLLKEHEILITLTGTVGKRDYGYTYRIRKEKGLLLNQRVARIICTAYVNPIYCDFHLKTDTFLNQFFDVSRGGTGNQSNVGTKDVEEIKIPVPPKAEQTAIATALSDMDGYISSLEKLIAKKRLIKQGAMQELLTPKEDWEVRKLGEMGEFKNGINKGEEEFGFGYPFVNLLDVFGKKTIMLTSNLGLVNSSISERKMYNLKKGDVLFIRSSVKPEGVGLTSLITGNLEDTVYSGFLIRFRDDGFLDYNFKIHCFFDEDFRKRLIESSTVSANTNINQNSLKQLDLFFPSIEEQKRIGVILNNMDSDIISIEHKLEKSKQIKQGMMQELLTGRIRLV